MSWKRETTLNRVTKKNTPLKRVAETSAGRVSKSNQPANVSCHLNIGSRDGDPNLQAAEDRPDKAFRVQPRQHRGMGVEGFRKGPAFLLSRERLHQRAKLLPGEIPGRLGFAVLLQQGILSALKKNERSLVVHGRRAFSLGLPL